MRFALRFAPGTLGSDQASAVIEADPERRLPGRGLYAHWANSPGRTDCLGNRQLEKLLVSGFMRALAKRGPEQKTGAAPGSAETLNTAALGKVTTETPSRSGRSGEGRKKSARIAGLSDESKELLGRNTRANNNGVPSSARNGERAPKRKIRL